MVATTAAATAGDGQAGASASCVGAPSCRYSYSAQASSAARSGANTAHAAAHGTGGGHIGGGGVSVYARAQAGPGSATAAAGCQGAANCSTSFGSDSASSAGSPDGKISANSGADCHGGGAAGGYCSTGSQAVYDAANGQVEASSYCASSGGSCSKYAHASAEGDVPVPGGTLTSHSPADCSGGAGSCSVVAVAKYIPASVKDGNPVPPTLVAGSGCQATGGGTCTQSSRADLTISGTDGRAKVTGTGSAVCGGGQGSCSTVVAGAYDPTTGLINAYTDCEATGSGVCSKSEAHVSGQVSGPGQAVPGGPTQGTVSSSGPGDCVRTSGECALTGVYHYEPASWAQDKNGNPIYQTGPDGKPAKDANGNNIPVPVPAYTEAAVSCEPAGPGCHVQATSSGQLHQHDDTSTHNGTADSACSGSSGSCDTQAGIGYDPNTGRITATADCEGDQGATDPKCSKSETHTDAWAGHDVLTGSGKSDCVQTGGTCTSVSLAKWYATTTDPTTGKDMPIPHVESGAGCETSGPQSGCSYSYSANGKKQATADNGKLNANAKADCGHSGTTGSGFCSVAATATADQDKHQAGAQVWCMSDAKTNCSYSAHAEAKSDSGKNNADAPKDCGAHQTGSCDLGVAADSAGSDEERQGQAAAAGFCDDSNGTCRGEFRTHVDSDWDTLSDCSSAGNGSCFSEAAPDHAKSWGQSDQAIHFHDKVPGEEDNKTCQAHDASCADPAHVFDQNGQHYYQLNADTHKSVGGFFKNLGRDAADDIVHVVPNLAKAVGTELWNTTFGWNWGDGTLAGYAKAHPLTGGIAQGAVDFYNRWLNGGGSWSKIGHDYYFAPFSTLLNDAGTVSLLALGAGAVIKILAIGTEATSLAADASVTTGIRGALSSLGQLSARIAPTLNDAAGTAFDLARLTGNIAISPLKINFAAGRLTAGLASELLLDPTANLLARGAGWAERGATDAGRFNQLYNVLGTGLRGISGVLGDAAWAGRTLGEGGLFGRTVPSSLSDRLLGTGDQRVPGLVNTLNAYRVLGITRDASPEAVQAAADQARTRLSDKIVDRALNIVTADQLRTTTDAGNRAVVRGQQDNTRGERAANNAQQARKNAQQARNKANTARTRADQARTKADQTGDAADLARADELEQTAQTAERDAAARARTAAKRAAAADKAKTQAQRSQADARTAVRAQRAARQAAYQRAHPDDPSAAPADPNSLIERIRTEVAANGGQPLSLAELSRRVGAKKSQIRTALDNDAAGGARPGDEPLLVERGGGAPDRVSFPARYRYQPPSNAWENRLYAPGLQTLVEQIPGLGEWLDQKMHLKLPGRGSSGTSATGTGLISRLRQVYRDALSNGAALSPSAT
ncbi:MAG TPA: hypothetical protein VH008_03415, partial [Pseudonocardia sp.]|nr:hypothetical protein [Pseudonocardia sp.]